MEPVQRTRVGMWFCLAAAAAALAGCSGGDGRVAVRGKVTLDGKPLASGLINFRPAPGTTANSAGGQIKDGNYDLPAASGLKPGKYQVTIQTFRETGRTIEDPQVGKTAELAEVKFQEADKLEATVAAGGGNQFDFQLTTSTAAGR